MPNAYTSVLVVFDRKRGRSAVVDEQPSSSNESSLRSSGALNRRVQRMRMSVHVVMSSSYLSTRVLSPKSASRASPLWEIKTFCCDGR